MLYLATPSFSMSKITLRSVFCQTCPGGESIPAKRGTGVQSACQISDFSVYCTGRYETVLQIYNDKVDKGLKFFFSQVWQNTLLRVIFAVENYGVAKNNIIRKTTPGGGESMPAKRGIRVQSRFFGTLEIYLQADS